MRRGGETPGDGAGEIGLYQCRRRAWVALQLGLIAEHAIGEQQNVEAAELLDHLASSAPASADRAIERHAIGLRGAARHEIGGDRVQAVLVSPDEHEPRAARRPKAGGRLARWPKPRQE